jgi:hypothetical protein
MFGGDMRANKKNRDVRKEDLLEAELILFIYRKLIA